MYANTCRRCVSSISTIFYMWNVLFYVFSAPEYLNVVLYMTSNKEFQWVHIPVSGYFLPVYKL